MAYQIEATCGGQRRARLVAAMEGTACASDESREGMYLVEAHPRVAMTRTAGRCSICGLTAEESIHFKGDEPQAVYEWALDSRTPKTIVVHKWNGE